MTMNWIALYKTTAVADEDEIAVATAQTSAVIVCTLYDSS